MGKSVRYDVILQFSSLIDAKLSVFLNQNLLNHDRYRASCIFHLDQINGTDVFESMKRST